MQRLWRDLPRGCIALLVLLLALSARSPVAQAGGILEGVNRRISDAGAVDATLARITEHNGSLYAVWVDDRDEGHGPGAPSGVYFARSTDGGESWSANRQVNDTPLEDWVNEPDIAVQPDGTIWVVWHLRTAWVDGSFPRRNDVRIAKSTDGGESFQVSTLVDGVDGERDRWSNRIVVDASTGTPYVMTHSYEESENSEGFDFYLLRYNETSGEWSSPTIINDVPHPGRLRPTTGPKYSPWFSLDAREGLVCAAWEDRGRSIDERQPIYGACSTDGGASFGPNFLISDDDNIRPEISIGPDGELYAIYAIDSESEKNIRLRHSDDQGETWSEAQQVTYADGGETAIRDWEMAVDANDQLLITYVHDYGAFDPSDLYLATSIDQGQNFSFAMLEDEQGERPTTTDQARPSLAVGGAGEETYAVVAWKDRRNSTDEIWSQRILLDGIPPTAPAALTATPAERAVRLTWEDAEDAAGVAGYRVYRATDAAGPFIERTVRLVLAATTEYVDVELDTTPYFYRVAAVDNAGNLGPMAPAVAATAQAPGSPTFGGTLAYQIGGEVRIRSLTGEAEERTITEAAQPRFSADGTHLYYRSAESIVAQPVEGDQPEIYYTVEGLADYDMAATTAGSYYAAIVSRDFGVGYPPGFCLVHEPTYGRPGQTLYTSQYEYGLEIALSADRRWMVYRTLGFCHPAASDVYSIPRLCLVDLASSGEDRENCLLNYDYRTPDFAPTGHWVVLAAPFSGQNEIWKAQVQEGGTLSNFVQLTRGPEGQPAHAPTWLSDGSWIAFQRDVQPGAEESWQLYVVRADGVGLRALNITGERPAWLGDGQTPGNEENKLFLPQIVR